MPIPIIDLFAGPGGLGEGFSSLTNSENEAIFKIKLSIEKDEYAHRTLELRAFFREFSRNKAPKDYYEYLAGRITREQLFERHPQEAKQASEEAWLAELGGEATPNDLIDERIRKSLGKSTNWLLIGGPPCQAYSLVGRSRIRGESEEKYQGDRRHYLYREYLRILAVHQPPIFIMENVKGLLSAEVKKERIFQNILSDLADPCKAIPEVGASKIEKPFTYRLMSIATPPTTLLGDFEPEDFLVRAEQYGIPQARHRLIILGIRSDLVVTPEILQPTPEVSIEDVIGDLPKLRSGLSKELDSPRAWQQAVKEIVAVQWLYKEAPEDIRKTILSLVEKVSPNLSRGSEFIEGATTPNKYADWFTDKKLGGIGNHSTRGHIRTDLYRYFFASIFAQINKRSPLLEDFPRSLLPAHVNVKAALKETKFNDRFRVQLKGRPSTTVVSHISKDGHYYIHYDPSQCRSLTVREAARLQTFPDNYFFEGGRTQQYKQVGNAVPPLLARKIAEIVAELMR